MAHDRVMIAEYYDHRSGSCDEFKKKKKDACPVASLFSELSAVLIYRDLR
jgi:hypothetical protein